MRNRFENIVKKSVLKISPYVPGKPVEEVQRELGLKDVIKLASNENPLGPSKKAIAALKKKAETINFYPESSVYYLRKALSKKLKVGGNRLFFGNGSNELEQLIAEAFVMPGDEVIFSELSFVVYPIVTNIAGGKIVSVPHKDFRHDIDGFIKRFNKRTKLVFLCNPNNPTGSMMTRPEFERLMKAVSANTIVVLDEAYFEYAPLKETFDGMKYLPKHRNLIVLRTFSKIYGLAGLRVGYGAAHPHIVDIIERVRTPFNVSSVAQAAAEAALSDTEHYKKTIIVNNKGKEYLLKEFEEMGIKALPTGANFIFVKFRDASKLIFNRLLKKGIIIRTASGNYARVTIGTMEQNRKLIKALK